MRNIRIRIRFVGRQGARCWCELYMLYSMLRVRIVV